MGLFSFFRSNRKRPETDLSHEELAHLAAEFSLVRSQLSNHDSQIGAIHVVLSRHEHAIAQCQDLTDRNSRKLVQLEDLVNRPPTPTVPSANPSVDTSQDAPTQPPVQSFRRAATQQLDINRFSEQQRRLLAVFFQNRDHHLSYTDVAVRLGLSPCTIKNQINKIRRKADLFERSSGPQNRNYFRLKDDLRVERLLRMGRSLDQSGAMPWPDPAEHEPVRTPARDSFSYPRA